MREAQGWRRGRCSVVAWLVITAFVAACRSEAAPSPEPEPHAIVLGSTSEAELGTLRLSDEAVAHLGIETTTVAETTVPGVRSVVGFVTIPPGRGSSVVAPIAGTLRAGARMPAVGEPVEAGQILLRLVPLAPVDRDVRAQARRQSAITRARLEVARARVERLGKLIDSRAASQRALEEATGELAAAVADDQAAQARERAMRRAPLASDIVLDLPAPQRGILRSIAVVPGQSVPAGAALFEVVPTDGLWVRAPVYPGELDRLDMQAPARVTRLGITGAPFVVASPVAAPPSADPINASLDLFYGLPSGADFERPGERVRVELTERHERGARVLPASAVVLDFDGGAWVYECLGQGAFRRRRVEAQRRDGARLIVTGGPAVGTCVVTVGAMELLGAEVGVKH